jgi:transposase
MSVFAGAAQNWRAVSRSTWSIQPHLGNEDRSQGDTLPLETRKGRRKKKKGNPQFNLREELFRMTGTDLTQIDDIDIMAAMTVVSEVGCDMSEWKTENHFVSWLKLSPDNGAVRSKST